MRDRLIADCHTHLYLQERRLYPYRTVTFGADDLLARMDESGVQISVVLTHPRKAATLEDGRREHDDISSATEGKADRLVPFAWFTPRWGVEGVAEVGRCITELGFLGLILDPIDDGYELDDPAILGACEVAAEENVPVFVETYLEARGAEPWRLVDLAKQFPEVPFIMAHLGGIGLQQNMGGATLAAEVPNIYIETSCAKSDPFGIFEGPARILGAERVLLGSNTPLHHASVNLASVQLTELTSEQQDLITGRNLLRLIGRRAEDN